MTITHNPMTTHAHLDDLFSQLQRAVSVTLHTTVERLFTTDASNVYGYFLEALPREDRQYMNCSACRSFMESYGGLVMIQEDGALRSWLRDVDAPEYYKDAIAMVAWHAERSVITGVFVSKAAVWGVPEAGGHQHLYGSTPALCRHTSRAQTAGQYMAEKKEDYRTVARALSEYTLDALNTAIRLLESDSLYRSEKVLGAATWLRDLHIAANVKNRVTRHNIIWRAVADAPAGFCHPRSSMIGTLLDDIMAGMAYEDVSARFAAKMHPLRYQRPQAAPAAGTIAQAEKLVEQLGVASALRRRFARLDEVDAFWKPAPKEDVQAVGVFGHLLPKGSAKPLTMALPRRTMTWALFQRTVLPNVTAMQLYAPYFGNFTAITTAVDPDAPSIFQWDHPFSSYGYHPHSYAHHWGLRADTWIDVTALTAHPAHWYGKAYAHYDPRVHVLLSGAKDSRIDELAIFPETLKSEYHGIRSVIEAYSKRGVLEGREDASACGLTFGKNSSGVVIRVQTAGSTTWDEYTLDRWE